MLAAYLAAFMQTLIAAGTFLVAKDATSRFSALELAWFRIILSGVLVAGVFLATRSRHHLPARRDWPVFVALGLLGVTMNQMCFLLGIRFSTPLHASLLYAFTPILVLVGAILHLGERPTWRRWAGVVLAVGGVVLVLTARGLDLAAGVFRGDLIILVAVFAWSAYTLVGKRVLARYDPFMVITLVFGVGALSVLPAAPWVLGGFHFARPGVAGWAEILYLGAITSGVAFTLWYYALKRLEASQVAVFTNLQAPFTALLAWMVLGTVPSGQVLVGGALVLAGVTLVQISGNRRRMSLPEPGSG